MVLAYMDGDSFFFGIGAWLIHFHSKSDEHVRYTHRWFMFDDSTWLKVHHWYYLILWYMMY
jgi:hypothetical protein